VVSAELRNGIRNPTWLICSVTVSARANTA